MLKQSFNEDEMMDMICEEIRLIIEEAGTPVEAIRAEHRLNADLGLSSLSLARLVAALELRTGADPFQELVSITAVRTVYDLLDGYRRFFAGDGPEQSSEELLATKRRAAARKQDKE